jgi:hypothetical protein
LAELSVHIGHSGLLLVAAGAFALLALTARGPLGVARLIGPRLHATLDVAVAVAMAAAPVLPAFRPDINGILVVEVAAVAWVRLATLTRYTRAPAGAGTRPASGDGALGDRASGDRASGDIGPRPFNDAPGSAPRPARVAARGLGILAGRSARRLPDAEETLRSGARQVGRHAARLQRTWRKPPP